MILDCKTHFKKIILASLDEFLDVEKKYVQLQNNRGALEEIEKVKFEVIRRARSAAIELHHFSELVLATQPNLILDTSDTQSLNTLKSKLKVLHCQMKPQSNSIQEIDLLCDVADAFKHFELRKDDRTIKNSDDVQLIYIAWGNGVYGEGYYGGFNQVIVKSRSFSVRVLSSVLKKIAQTWCSILT